MRTVKSRSRRKRGVAHVEVDGDVHRGAALIARQLLIVLPHAVLLQVLLVVEHHEAILDALRVVARKVLVPEMPCRWEGAGTHVRLTRARTTAQQAGSMTGTEPHERWRRCPQHGAKTCK